MMSHGLSRVPTTAVVLATCILGSIGSAAWAADGDVPNFFQQLFGSRPEPQGVAPSSDRVDNSAYRSRSRYRYGYRYGYGWPSHWERRTYRRPIRYASLPKSQKIEAAVVSEAPKPVLACHIPRPDPAAAVLTDTTLRRGDIVMLRDGPRVFVGKSNVVHTARDFEKFGSSRQTDHRARNLIPAKTMVTATGSFIDLENYLTVNRSPTRIIAPAASITRVRVSLPGSVRTVFP